MVYSALKSGSLSRGFLLTVNRTARRLNRTRPTVKEWIAAGILIPHEAERIGKRMNYWFESDYIEALAKILPPKKAGGAVLDDNLKAAIDGINRRFRKTR